MGAWGEHSFDNDAAADWLLELADQGAVAVPPVLERAIAEFDAGEVDLDTSSAAIAAADIVAIAMGHGRTGENADHVTAAKAVEGDLKAMPGIVDLARQSVTAAGAPQTEIYALWTEDGAEGDWIGAVAGLMARLEAAHLDHGGAWEFTGDVARDAMPMTPSEATALRLDVMGLLTRLDMLSMKIDRKLDALSAKIDGLEKGAK